MKLILQLITLFLVATVLLNAHTVTKIKEYHFGKNKIVLTKYMVGDDLQKSNYEEDQWFDIYYELKAYQSNEGKPLYSISAAFLEIMDTPYKFPYIVVHGAGLDENNYLTLLDISDSLRVVQSINHTTLDFNELKMRNNSYQDMKSIGLFHWFSNPIVMGNDGKYYLKAYEAVGKAKCNSCQKYERVLYRFNGDKFQKYKTFVWDENATQKMDAIVWEK